jgi:phosphoserine phosphatase RsbU/P
MAGDKVFGVLALNKKGFGERFTARDFERIELFARFGSLIVNELISVMENSELTDIEREAAIAADIQKTLLPKRLPELPNASFGAFSVPTRGVCGDYYDIIPFRHNRICLVIGDVAGKGIPSSIVMVMIRSILHLITSAQKDIATIINWVNRGITGRIDMDHFATLSLIFYDTESGTLEYTNAGHQPLMIYRKETGTVSTIKLKGVPIGVERTTQYERVSLAVAKDDIVILYTDGVIEAMNREGRQYGAASLARAIEKNADLTAKEIANKVKMDIQDFMGSARQHDDQTLLLMKVKL